MCSFLKSLEKQFVEQGGIKERMYAARTGYRKQQDEERRLLLRENEQLKAELKALKERLKRLEGENREE